MSPLFSSLKESCSDFFFYSHTFFQLRNGFLESRNLTGHSEEANYGSLSLLELKFKISCQNLPGFVGAAREVPDLLAASLGCSFVGLWEDSAEPTNS